MNAQTFQQRVLERMIAAADARKLSVAQVLKYGNDGRLMVYASGDSWAVVASANYHFQAGHNTVQFNMTKRSTLGTVDGYLFSEEDTSKITAMFARWEALLGPRPGDACYSDHYEDIRTKGSCDYCGGTE